jgi:hypothetical protein
MTDINTYRCRFRFFLQKKLSINENEYRFTVEGREIVLCAPVQDTPIKDSEWLVMNVRDFATEEEARTFGNNLKAAVELSSVITRLGVNAGVDKPTSALYDVARKQIEQETGSKIRNNTHGIDVFLDEPNVTIFSFNATATVHALPTPFLTNLNELHNKAANVSQRVKDIVLLLNYALMQRESVAQIVFAVSAVEMLGQDAIWSDDQKLLLKELVKTAKSADIGSQAERDEVADAIEKSIHRQTLRQGVFKLLVELGLPKLKKEWDKLYSERSKLVHGLAPQPGVNYSELANKTMNLCGQILLRAIAVEIELAGSNADAYYQIS